MAQVKTQTATNHSGPAVTTPATSTPSVTTTNSVGLQPSVNGSVPELAVDSDNSTSGLADCTSSLGKWVIGFLLGDFCCYLCYLCNQI